MKKNTGSRGPVFWYEIAHPKVRGVFGLVYESFFAFENGSIRSGSLAGSLTGSLVAIQILF